MRNYSALQEALERAQNLWHRTWYDLAYSCSMMIPDAISIDGGSVLPRWTRAAQPREGEWIRGEWFYIKDRQHLGVALECRAHGSGEGERSLLSQQDTGGPRENGARL